MQVDFLNYGFCPFLVSRFNSRPRFFPVVTKISDKGSFEPRKLIIPWKILLVFEVLLDLMLPLQTNRKLNYFHESCAVLDPTSFSTSKIGREGVPFDHQKVHTGDYKSTKTMWDERCSVGGGREWAKLNGKASRIHCSVWSFHM